MSDTDEDILFGGGMPRYPRLAPVFYVKSVVMIVVSIALPLIHTIFNLTFIDGVVHAYVPKMILISMIISLLLYKYSYIPKVAYEFQEVSWHLWVFAVDLAWIYISVIYIGPYFLAFAGVWLFFVMVFLPTGPLDENKDSLRGRG